VLCCLLCASHVSLGLTFVRVLFGLCAVGCVLCGVQPFGGWKHPTRKQFFDKSTIGCYSNVDVCIAFAQPLLSLSSLLFSFSSLMFCCCALCMCVWCVVCADELAAVIIVFWVVMCLLFSFFPHLFDPFTPPSLSLFVFPPLTFPPEPFTVLSIVFCTHHTCF